MKALSLNLGLISVSIVLLSGVASAKGPGLDHVTLNGPGIGEPVTNRRSLPVLPRSPLLVKRALSRISSQMVYGTDAQTELRATSLGVRERDLCRSVAPPTDATPMLYPHSRFGDGDSSGSKPLLRYAPSA